MRRGGRVCDPPLVKLHVKFHFLDKHFESSLASHVTDCVTDHVTRVMVANAWLLLSERRLKVVDYLPLAWMEAGVDKRSPGEKSRGVQRLPFQGAVSDLY